MPLVRSQNGWSANDRSMVASYQIPGGKVALRKGDVSVILIWCAQRWHETVEPLVWPGNWGYAERPVRGSATTLSNHASGTAIDLNAPKHPLGVRGTFSAGQVRAVRAILGFCEGVVRWGEDYRSRADGMHLEINAGAADVRRVADKIRALPSSGGFVAAGKTLAPPPPPPAPPWTEEHRVHIPLPVDAYGRFRATAMVETASVVASDAYATCASTWGKTKFLITVLRHDGAVLAQWRPVLDNNRQWGDRLPVGARIITFEGLVEFAPVEEERDEDGNLHQSDPGTQPAAAIWTLPPK
jgi:hypothetical protein